MSPLSLVPEHTRARAHEPGEQPVFTLLTAHTGVAIAHIHGEQHRRVLIDPSRAVLLRSAERLFIEAAVPHAQEIGLIEFAPRLLQGRGFAGRSLGHRLSLASSPIDIPWSSRLTLGLLLLLRGRRQAHADVDAGSPLADDLAALLHRALADFDAPGAGKRRSGSRADAAHRELVHSAKMVIAAAPERSHLLADIARTVSASSFHLEHVFQQRAGIPLHRFLLDFRLTLALNHLATDSNIHLSRLALALGFATHSHFTAAFHRALGQTPTAVRRALFAAPTRAFSGPDATRHRVAWLRILPTRACDGPLTIPFRAHTHAPSLCGER